MNTSQNKRLILSRVVRAKLGGIGTTCFYNLRKERTDFPKPKIIGRMLFWDEGEIDKWINEQPEVRFLDSRKPINDKGERNGR